MPWLIANIHRLMMLSGILTLTIAGASKAVFVALCPAGLPMRAQLRCSAHGDE